jgi:hypothetical protein
LVQVTSVVRKIEHKVVGHSNVQLLHSFSLVSNLGHCCLNIVLSFHEVVICTFDFLYHAWGVNCLLPICPLYWSQSCVLCRFIEELKNGSNLAKLVSAIVSVRCWSESSQPLVSQMFVLLCVLDYSAVTWSSHSLIHCSGLKNALSKLLPKDTRHLFSN